MSAISSEAQAVMLVLQKYCTNSAEVWHRAIRRAAQQDRGIEADDVTWAMRNIGKPPGGDVPVGAPSRPMALTWTSDLSHPVTQPRWWRGARDESEGEGGDS